MCARAEDLLHGGRKLAQALSELEVRYDNAYEPLRRLEELDEEVAGVMEDFRHETNNSSKPNKDNLFTQLHNVLNKGKIWGRDLDYLEQLLLDGHKIPESIQTWYTYKIETAEETFRTQSKDLSKRLEPLRDRLGQAHEALVDLYAEVSKARGFSDSQIPLEIQEVFYASPSTDSDEVRDEPQERSWNQDGTGLRLECAEAFASALCNMVVWIKFQSSKLEASGHVEQEGHDIGHAYNVNMDWEIVNHDPMEEENPTDGGDELYNGDRNAESMHVDMRDRV